MTGHRDRPRGHGLATLLYLALLAAVAGAYAGLVETTLLPTRGVAAIGAAGVVNVAVFYAVLWTVVGLLIGLVALLAGAVRRSRPDENTRRAFYGSLLVTLVVLVLVGSLVNIELLPTVFAKESLIFDAALLVGCAFLWLGLFRVSRRVMARPSSGWYRSPLVLASLALVVVLVITAAASREQEAAGGDETRVAAQADLNIILVVVDALRADHLGCYGYPKNTSPNIDRLATEGVLFSRAYAQAPRTKESTASLVTSLYPSTHNVSRLGNVLPESSRTLTEMTRDAGFATAVVSANPLVWIAPLMARAEALLPIRGATYPFAGRDADRLNAAFIGWLDGLGDAPFFAYLHYMEPHAPYAPPPPYDTMFDPGYMGPKVTGYPAGESLMLPFVEGAPVPEAERVNMVAQYDGSIAHFDREFGTLLTELDRLSAAAASRKQDSGTTVIDQETEERLRALGYVQ